METKELAKAFEEKPKKRISPLAIFVIGLTFLIIGATFLIVKLVNIAKVDDAERLVEIGTFVKEGGTDVIWRFTEIGKGTLTTNNHTNDYDFIWAIDGNKLKIETAWLYDLNNEYSYKIDGDKLVLDEEIIFVPAN